MPRKKTPKKAAPHPTKPRRVKPNGARSAAVRSDFAPILDLVARAQERGVFDPKNRLRIVAKPTVSNTPVAPFVRIVNGAKTEDEQLRALEAAANEEVTLPAEAFVIGEPVSAIAITYSGHPRAGLTLWCIRGGVRFTVGLGDVAFPPGSEGARFVSLYRAWLGLGELNHITVDVPVDLIVLACRSNALRCRMLGETREVTLRTAVRNEVPGAIITVMPTKQWIHARHAYLAGSVLSMRADVEALGLVPIALRDEGEWDPEEEYWGEEGEPLEDWAKPIVALGRRPMFEMEQVVPGVETDDVDSDPICEASELHAAGNSAGARGLLMNLLERDLRCLDAHAHLGNFAFNDSPAEAQRHYEIGMSIGAF